MECTSCKKGILREIKLDDLFRAHQCSNCESLWVMIDDYLEWDGENKEPFDGELIESNDSSKALLCPRSGSLMRKFKINSKTSHRIDYSAQIGGVWLDKGEWELLKQEGLSSSLNSILTEVWQRDIHRQEKRKNIATLYEKRLGKASYEKIKRVRDWISSHDNADELLSYLIAKDPYDSSIR